MTKISYIRAIVILSILSCHMFPAMSQAIYRNSATRPDTISVVGQAVTEPYDTIISLKPLYRSFFTPIVYDNYRLLDSISIFEPDYSGNEALRWIEDANAMAERGARLKQDFMISQPGKVRYNINTLPEAPKEYHAVVNPEDHTITIHEVVTKKVDHPTITLAEIKKRHWIRTFNSSLQFSQAYVSPNWYQGGNNNLNMFANIYYNVKLNQEYHPKLLFESTLQYKLGMNNAPDDEFRDYSISEDLLQFNTTFGLKAARRWYYSITAQFKTQILNSYTSNTNDLRSAFLSPSELTAGIGMTYNYANPKKTFTFDASISPLSYNLVTCINSKMNGSDYNIDPGKKYVMKFGSSAESKIMWKIAYNITLNSRMFVFSDYDRIQADWENTISFEINRFLTTQIYVHARYDSSTPDVEGQEWHKFQLKEILSFGFAYKFSSL